ncbi:MAG: superoxide dismutase [Pelolinea sp.]|nr:superoxide dismutase [Pelolinea sp.]
MSFILPELNFDYNALEPYMDAQTVGIHHDKHHAGYTKKLNSAIEKHPEFFNQEIVTLLNDLSELPENIRSAVRNNGGGYYHHNLWWEQLSPGKSGDPSGKIADALKNKFGDLDSFKSQMNDAALGVFGSGWAWLCKNNSGDLSIITTPNQDSPVSMQLTPLLTIDVWEHAYYLKFQNRRNEFVENFWNMVDWDVVNKRLG